MYIAAFRRFVFRDIGEMALLCSDICLRGGVELFQAAVELERCHSVTQRGWIMSGEVQRTTPARSSVARLSRHAKAVVAHLQGCERHFLGRRMSVASYLAP